MPEHDLGSERQEVVGFDRVGRRRGDSEPLRRAPHERWIADRVGGRHQQQAPRVPGKARQPPREALLDAGGQRHGRGQAEPAGELGGRQPARQLHERQWVPVRLRHDPRHHALVQPS
jgi:hypothetical protein